MYQRENLKHYRDRFAINIERAFEDVFARGLTLEEALGVIDRTREAIVAKHYSKEEA